jgi:hypothetical protein
MGSSALENGMSRPAVVAVCIGPQRSTHHHVFVSVSAASNKFWKLYEQIEDEEARSDLLGSLNSIFVLFPDNDTLRHHYVETEFRKMAMMCGPEAQLGWCKRLYCRAYQPTAEWREQVKELVVALKAITTNECEILWWKMCESAYPTLLDELMMVGAIKKEEMC